MRGGVIILASRRFADLIRDAIVGMTGHRVLELTGMKASTYQKMTRGENVRPDKVLQFCKGLGIDAHDLLQANAEAAGRMPVDESEVFSYALAQLSLPQSAKIELLRVYRELRDARASPAEQQSAA